MKAHSLLVGLACGALLALAPRFASAEQPFNPDYEEEPAEPVPSGSSSLPAESPQPKPQPKVALRGMVAGGATTTRMFQLQATGMHLDAGFGIEKGKLYVPFQLNADLGQTPNGIGMGDVTANIAMQGIAGRFRIGGGLGTGYGWFTRADTSTGGHVGMWALDAFALATVDLFNIGENRAVYIGVKPTIGVRWGESIFAFGHGTYRWGGAATAGFRF